MTPIGDSATAPELKTPAVRPTGGIVVATDGTHDSDGAVRVGHALATRNAVTTDLYSVVEPLPPFETESVPVADGDQLLAISREAREAALLAQRDRTHPGIQDWPFTVDVGDRVEKILERATGRNASLVLLGLGAHGVGARLRQRETALRVIRAAGKPVLAVPPDAWGVPHSVLAAIDFTPSSELAARTAIDLLAGEGTLYLAHVTPRVPIPQGDSRTWDEITSSAVIRQLETVARRLDPSPGIEIEYVLLHGDPAHELDAFADERGIDLIAAGTHGRSGLGRLVLGSVSTRLVRTSRHWVLVGPPHPDARSLGEPSSPNDWE